MSRSQIEEIKDKLDILEVARSYITNFKKSGSNYFALCPFHQEKTPSFSVNPDMGIFKCFGCGKSGDVITFIQDMEGVDFPKALEIAAKRAGVKLERNFTKQDQETYKEKQRILEINALVAEYYKFILEKHKKGKKGKEYAKERKVTKELIEKFKIGYAPQAYTNLINFLQKKGYKKQELIRWGLAVAGQGRVYDKFRGRLIFPLINHYGDIVGFSGRTIFKQTKAPKYLHSPQTLAFDKSSFLFGLEQAKSQIRKKDFVVFCEGQLDVISSHKTRVKNIVASLGTSLSVKQLELAKRYTQNIYFCFDNDLAGETALIRAVSLAHNEGFNVKAITIPKSKDADELINTKKSEWEKAVKEAEPIVDHMLRRLYRRLDLNELRNKEEFSKIMLPIIAKIPQKIEKSHYIHRLALILNVDENILIEELESISKSSEIMPQVNTQKIKKVLQSPVNIKEEYLMSLVFQHLQFMEVSLKTVKALYFSSPLGAQIITKLKKYYKEKKKFSLKNFVSGLEPYVVTYLQDMLLKKLGKYYEIEEEFVEELEQVMRVLKKNYLQSKIRKIKSRIETAEIAENKAEMKKLLKKLLDITDELGTV